MILSAEFSKGFFRQDAAAKKASAAIGRGVSGGGEGSVRIRGVVGVRRARKRSRKTFQRVTKATKTEAGAVSAVETRPNQSLEPTPTSVTSRADARLAPAGAVAHLGR